MVDVLDDFHWSDGHTLGVLADFIGARSSFTVARAVFAAVLVVLVANMDVAVEVDFISSVIADEGESFDGESSDIIVGIIEIGDGVILGTVVIDQSVVLSGIVFGTWGSPAFFDLEDQVVSSVDQVDLDVNHLRHMWSVVGSDGGGEVLTEESHGEAVSTHVVSQVKFFFVFGRKAVVRADRLLDIVRAGKVDFGSSATADHRSFDSGASVN